MKLTYSAILIMAAWAVSAGIPPSVEGQQSAFEFELEGGLTWQSYNDVEIPNDGTATRFSLFDLAGSGPWPRGRLYLTWHVADRHSLRLLAAPFSITESAAPDSPIVFVGESYTPGVPAEATYTFNSYRLSYRWRFHSGARSTAWLGFTAKVRDATVRLEQGSTSSQKDDLGFVPLLHLAGDWYLNPRWHLSLDADALAGGPGRAVDASLKLGYDLGNGWAVRAGYRTLEGGADVESVYSFAWLHYAVVSVGWRP